MDPRSDRELVIDVREGSIRAFEVLVKRYEERLLSFVYRILRSEADAEEIVQDTFFKIYRIIDQVDTSKKFSTYIFEIAKNAAISRLRRKKFRTALDENSAIESDERIYEILASKEKAGEVRKAIGALPLKYRSVIQQYYFEDLSYEEISKKMDLPINTVRTHIARAKAALRKVITYD